MRNPRVCRRISAVVLFAGSVLGTAEVQAEQIKPLIDLRLRYEAVEQDPPPTLLTRSADALTLRGRIGIETGHVASTALLVEGVFVTRLAGFFRTDNAVPGRLINYPVIADPSVAAINRLQLVNTALPHTTITLGRQRIQLDDQRFIGNSGWRQNEQTFDALRVVNRSIAHLTVDATYFDRVQRVFGSDSPQGVYRGHGLLGNAGYTVASHQLSAFVYQLRLDPQAFPTGPGVTASTATALNPARSATATWGLRAAGTTPLDKLRLGYAFSWARQSDTGANPLHLDNGYYLAELNAGYRAYTLTLGEEMLQGNGTVGFSTPLATLHKFQGWADKFLITPANGLRDRYVAATALYKPVGRIDSLTLNSAWHAYRTDRLGQNYGSEWNLLAAAKFHRYTVTMKYADYRSGHDSAAVAGFGNTTKLWAQIEYIR